MVHYNIAFCLCFVGDGGPSQVFSKMLILDIYYFYQLCLNLQIFCNIYALNVLI